MTGVKYLLLLPTPRAGLDDFRDGHDFGFLSNRNVEHHVNHLMNHGVELLLWDADAIEAPGELLVLVTAQHVDLADEAVYVVGRRPA